MKTIEKQNLIFHYLNKNYVIHECKFWTKCDSHIEFGNDIINSLFYIFDFKKEFCSDVLKFWSYLNGLEESDWEDAYSQSLQATLNLGNEVGYLDLQAYHQLDVNFLQQELSFQIQQEIDREIVQQLINMYNNE